MPLEILIDFCRRFIDSGGHTKDGVNEELCPGTQNDLIVEISATYTMLENKGKGTACMDFEDDEDSSEFNCKSRCRMNLIRVIVAFVYLFPNY